MSEGWSGPVWGEPSSATRARVPLRPAATAAEAGYRADGGFTDDFAVLGASTVGTGHRLASRRCDDAFAWAMAGPQTLVVAVADGVSGAAHGGRGADVAVGAVCRYVEEAAARPAGEHGAWSKGGSEWGLVLCLGAFSAANHELFEVATDNGWGPADLSTTLVVAALDRRGDKARVDIAAVGDSAAFVLVGGHWQEVGQAGDVDADEGVMHSTLTAVLPAGRAEEVGDIEVSSLELALGDTLVLLTDGVANPLRDGPTTVAPALAEVLAAGPSGRLSPLDLARAADFNRRGCQDDRTILAVWALGDQIYL